MAGKTNGLGPDDKSELTEKFIKAESLPADKVKGAQRELLIAAGDKGANREDFIALARATIPHRKPNTP